MHHVFTCGGEDRAGERARRGAHQPAVYPPPSISPSSRPHLALIPISSRSRLDLIPISRSHLDLALISQVRISLLDDGLGGSGAPAVNSSIIASRLTSAGLTNATSASALLNASLAAAPAISSEEITELIQGLFLAEGSKSTACLRMDAPRVYLWLIIDDFSPQAARPRASS